MNTFQRILAASTTALSLIGAGGCAAKSVDLGDNNPPAVTGASLSDYVGGWEGYAEAYDFGDGSDHIKIMLNGSGQGVLEVGDSEPLPEPDSAHGWPPSEDAQAMFNASYQLRPGFSYPLFDAVVESSRIRLKTKRSALYEEWCEGMTPVLDEANTLAEPAYGCLANRGLSSDEDGCYLGGDSDMPIDCGLFACWEACACTEESCTAANDTSDLVLDAALEDDGEQLEGTLVEGGLHIVVRMNRID